MIISFEEELHPVKNTSHAIFNCWLSDGRPFNFNHYKFYVDINKGYVKESKGDGELKKVLCEVMINQKNAITFRELCNYAIGLWFIRNIEERKEAWPGSCTGFTDFLMYCAAGKDIYNECYFTKHKTRLDIKTGTVSKIDIKNFDSTYKKINLAFRSRSRSIKLKKTKKSLTKLKKSSK